jgi:hypothetical protein
MGKVFSPQLDGLTQHRDVMHAGLKHGARAVRLLAGACRADVVLLAVFFAEAGRDQGVSFPQTKKLDRTEKRRKIRVCSLFRSRSRHFEHAIEWPLCARSGRLVQKTRMARRSVIWFQGKAAALDNE